MSDNRWTLEDRIGVVVQLLFGALLGALVGVSWVWWISPIDNPAVNWALFAAVVVICALLSLRYGEDLWTHLKDWI
jgi:NhaP-type Na+/H+ or K+/H+ antiporter